MYQWMLLEEILKDGIVFLMFLIKRQINLNNLDLREVIDHIMSESCFSVSLLFGANLAITRLFDKSHFFLAPRNQHQHLCSEIAASKRVLSKE